MILRDRVTILEGTPPLVSRYILKDSEVVWRTTVRARVDYRTTKDEAGNNPDGWSSWRESQNLVAILDYQKFHGLELSSRVHNIEWRGTRYSLDGPPLVQMRGDREHHLTVSLRRLES